MNSETHPDRRWIDAYCLEKPGVTREFKVSWNMHLYRVGDKIFAETGGDKAGAPILSVKLEPAFSELLRAQYPGAVVPGYYCNKVHWSSVYYDSAVPDDTVKAMLDNAYGIVFAALPKKVREAVLAEKSSD